MELPKNITQIGESDRSCKIYVEDYVVSYIKQLNQVACNKDMAVALYGTRRTENGITYLFVYGACKLDFLQRETRHLSQAQQQEIEKLRRKYFSEHEFQGYRLLNGEMVEGFHVCEQDICRYIKGYAQFYEKNDGMLAYMLDARTAEAEPEVVNTEKYDMVRRRQEERREESHKGDYRREVSGKEVHGQDMFGKEERRGEYRAAEAEREKDKKVQTASRSMTKMRLSTAAVFGLLCVAGLAMLWDEQSAEELQAAARQAMSELTEQKLPDAQQLADSEAELSTLIAEDKLSEAVLAENDLQAGGNFSAQGLVEMVGASAVAATPTPAPEAKVTPEPAATSEPVATATPEPVATSEPAVTAAPESGATPAPTAEPTPEPTPTPAPTATPKAASGTATASYIIQKGDTLIDICIRQYGTDEMVKTVCDLNDISNADDIKVGEKILLP